MCIKPQRLPHKFLPPELWLEVPCQNKCPECLQKRATDWATRVKHQLAITPDSCFITLTYDNEKSGSSDYHYSDFQKFMKVLRSRYDHQTIKHFTSIEYGGQHGRLHFHSILFNYYPTTRNHTIKELKTTDRGFVIYRSSELESMWTHGFSSIAPASVATGYYIASYALSDNSYECPISGEILSDRFRPSQGIGLDYFKLHRKTFINNALFHGRSIPRYYKKKLEQLYPSEFAEFELQLKDLKQTIIKSDDEYARLRESLSLSLKQSSTFRSPKSFELLEAQLNEHAYRMFKIRRYGEGAIL